jgi:type I restriction enzyme, S subunit
MFLPSLFPGGATRLTYFLREGKQTTNLASVNLTKLSEFPVPLPASAEQKQIVLEVERQFSVIEEMETQVLADLQRADRFRQAILQRAFRGKLKSNGYGSVSKAGSISKRQKR